MAVVVSATGAAQQGAWTAIHVLSSDRWSLTRTKWHLTAVALLSLLRVAVGCAWLLVLITDSAQSFATVLTLWCVWALAAAGMLGFRRLSGSPFDSEAAALLKETDSETDQTL